MEIGIFRLFLFDSSAYTFQSFARLIRKILMKKSNPILGITLEGFQVFENPTYIPLDRLTLIFGPNSAGKSAVQDALELCRRLQLTEYSTVQMIDGEARNLLERHWRRSDRENDLADRFCIGVKYALDDDFYSLNGRIDHGGPTCQVPCDYVPSRSWPLFRVRALLQAVTASFKSEKQP